MRSAFFVATLAIGASSIDASSTGACEDAVATHPLFAPHEFLTRFGEQDFEDMEKATSLLASAQRYYAQDFSVYVALTAAKLSPSAREQLIENYQEERGALTDEDRSILVDNGLNLAEIDGVPHNLLLKTFYEAAFARASPADADPNGAVAAAGTQFATDALSLFRDASPCVALATLGFAIEATVPQLYRHFMRGLVGSTVPSVYFDVHALLDEGHAGVLTDLFTSEGCSCADETVIGAMRDFLDERAALFDTALATAGGAAPAPVAAIPKDVSVALDDAAAPTAAAVPNAAELYDAQATNWVRTTESSLSDFTARRPVLREIGNLSGTTTSVLDLGCGEGFVSRRLVTEAGASKVTALDVSPGMIAQAAALEAQQSLGITYGVADATGFRETLDDGAEFDLVVAIFLFNYLDLNQTTHTMRQVRESLAPGGRFLFTVPHPALAFWQREPQPPFFFDTAAAEARGEPLKYFEPDVSHEGKIHKTDGTALNVRLFHKTFANIMGALADAGFGTLPTLTELTATPELVSENPSFFGPVEGVPLHALFSITK